MNSVIRNVVLIHTAEKQQTLALFYFTRDLKKTTGNYTFRQSIDKHTTKPIHDWRYNDIRVNNLLHT